MNADSLRDAADKAYSFAFTYVRDHGVYGETRWGKSAPEIPASVQSALSAIGGSVREGLQRINNTSGEPLAHLKREFVEAYMRARRLA